ncbi:MAG: ACT domain-containing protein [Oscillospiraceae bacterium]|nr:ACT domain-containing protein [Oscillospiraceae bacterium]
MSRQRSKLYIVEGSMLPEVFIKVCEAKEYLETGAADTVAEAVVKAGISRSAFYKYKDAISPFRDIKRDQVLTLSILMHDRPGALSAVLAIFADNKVNILTINQSISANGAAMVTLSIMADAMSISLDELRAQVEALPAVMRLELLAG